MSRRIDRRRGKGRWKCCNDTHVADTGRYSAGAHNHAPWPGALDHAFGKGFRKDKSTTKAIERCVASAPAILAAKVPEHLSFKEVRS